MQKYRICQTAKREKGGGGGSIFATVPMEHNRAIS